MAMVAEDIVLYPALPLVARGWKRKQQQPQQQQQQQLPQAEPSIFTCGTCKSVYSSSWFLVQHVQKTHGLKIYEEPSSPRESSPPPNPSPARPIVVQPDKILLNSGTGKDSGPASLTSPFHSGGSKSRSSNHGGPVSHRSPTCSPRSGAPSDMFSAFPFMHAGAPRQPATAPVSWASYATRSPTVMSEFAAMMHPELVMEQLRRIQGLTGAGDHLSSPFLRSPGLDSAAGQYSHSERLRLLAATGGATSPKHIPRKPDASYTSTPPSAFTTPTTTTTSVTSHHHHEKSGSSSSGGRQHKQCELCGKAFRFASNLVLHRRVHSGERPYACPLCTYASGQATALRRHMRSHVTAPAETPAEPHALTDSDIEDTEEFVQREAEAEAAIRQLERDAKTQKEAQDREQEEEPTDLSSNGGRHSVDTAPSPAPLSSQAEEEEEEDIVTDRASLLSEVMMKTGLSSLPNYKEAFTAALAEANNAKSPQRSQHSPHTPSSKHDKAEGESQATSPVKIEPHDHDDSVKDYTDGEVEEEEEKDEDAASEGSQRRSPLSRASSELSSTEQPPEKRIKRESSPLTRSPSSTAAAFPGADHLFQRAAMEAAAAQHSIYPGLWFPQTSTAAGPGGLPFSPFMSRGGEHTAAAMMSAAAASSRLQAAAAAAAASSENGLSPQASSAFSNTGGSPKLPSPDPANLSTSAKRRNDTCEFCGKVFKNCSNLTVHRRSHTGEKPYKCQLCPYACAQSSKLTRHMRTHGRHGKDVYRCKFCCMPFSVPSTLEKHMRKCVESQQRAAAAAAAAASRHLTSPLTSAPVV